MTSVRTLILLGMLVVLSGAGPPGMDEDKSPFGWKLEGESLETFKATLVVHKKVNATTPRGTVEAFLNFTETERETEPSLAAVKHYLDPLIDKSLASWEEKLLSADARKGLADARQKAEKPTARRTRNRPTVIESETKQSDGTVLVEGSKEIEVTRTSADGKEVSKYFSKHFRRFTCEKGDDGNWRISKFEEARGTGDEGRSDEDLKWKASYSPLSEGAVITEAKFEDATEPVQDTPENAAKSIYNSLKFKRKTQEWKAVIPLLAQILKQVEALVTTEFREAAKNEAKEMAGSFKDSIPKVSETESTTDGKDSAKLVTFKKSREWKDKVQVTLKQVEGKWVVVEAGRFKKANEDAKDSEAKYQSVADIYDLQEP